MSKTSYLLVLILAVCLGIFLFVKYSSSQDTKLPSLSENTEVSDTLAQGSLTLAPTSQTLVAGQPSIIDIFLETQNATPTVLQFELAYDPMVITPTQITPGKYFSNPTILLNDINPRNGRISYALKCSADYKKHKKADCGNITAEPVAKMAFVVNPYAVTKEMSLNIMPKTLLQTKEATDIMLKTMNAKIIIQGAAIPQASPSAVISQ